jgi:hypothetical protein
VRVGQDVIQLKAGVEGRAEVALRRWLGVVSCSGATRAFGIPAVVSVVVDEAVKHLVSLVQLLRKG